MDRLDLKRIIGEGLIIVVSVLLALSADAWLDSRKQDAQRHDHVVALARDFDQMHERVMASYAAASRAVQDGTRLLTNLQQGAVLDPDLSTEQLWHLIFYEVFSPSVGAYQALVASGNLQQMENDELERELADFFGSFDDLRASENLLLANQQAFIESRVFSQLAGWHRLGKDGLPTGAKVPLEQWSTSDEFMSGVGLQTLRQIDVLEDYEYLKTKIEKISAAIAAEVADGTD